jgi:uncharacterized protein
MMDINELLKPPKTIVVVGLSDKIERPSNQVAKYLLSKGLTIIPVNPNIESALGLKSYKSIKEIPKGIKIDIVDIFRKAEEIVPIVEEVIMTGQKPVVWLQEGLFSDEAKTLAEKYGLEMVEGICLMKAFQKQLL